MDEYVASSRPEKRAEVQAFLNQGMELDEALSIVGLSRRDYYVTGANERIRYLPTPAEIGEITARMRSGELQVGPQNRTANIREFRSISVMRIHR